jgi:hypothetical protein
MRAPRIAYFGVPALLADQLVQYLIKKKISFFLNLLSIGCKSKGKAE